MTPYIPKRVNQFLLTSVSLSQSGSLRKTVSPLDKKETDMLDPIQGRPDQNYLLAALPANTKERIFSHLELVELPVEKVIYESGDRLAFVYFPTNCIVSLLSVMENGATAEISICGNEGLVGIALFLGGETTPSRAVVQTGGYAYRLSAKIFKEELSRHNELQLMLLRYTQSLITQMAQTAVCNRHHSIEQQLCRWMLLSLDRISTNCITMTQELISNMLGVRREGITEAAGKLQKLGIISYSRGRITVLDRAKLEKASCECYAVVKRETDRLLSYVPSKIVAQAPSTKRISQDIF